MNLLVKIASASGRAWLLACIVHSTSAPLFALSIPTDNCDREDALSWNIVFYRMVAGSPRYVNYLPSAYSAQSKLRIWDAVTQSVLTPPGQVTASYPIGPLRKDDQFCLKSYPRNHPFIIEVEFPSGEHYLIYQTLGYMRRPEDNAVACATTSRWDLRAYLPLEMPSMTPISSVSTTYPDTFSIGVSQSRFVNNLTKAADSKSMACAGSPSFLDRDTTVTITYLPGNSLHYLGNTTRFSAKNSSTRRSHYFVYGTRVGSNNIAPEPPMGPIRLTLEVDGCVSIPIEVNQTLTLGKSVGHYMVLAPDPNHPNPVPPIPPNRYPPSQATLRFAAELAILRGATLTGELEQAAGPDGVLDAADFTDPMPE